MSELDIDLVGARILIVDDVPANIDILVQALEGTGFDIMVAADGETALEVAETVLPDLILLDVMMPGIDGFETCRRLKRKSRTATIPVVFITARGLTEDVVEGFNAGGVDYITKPFRREEVVARIENHLKLGYLQKRLRRTNEELEERVVERTAELVQMNGAYERFVPREFLAFLAKESIVEVSQGDQIQRDMAVMFTDIRDFTSLSEVMSPQENFNFINSYFERIGPVIRAHGGFVDKFIGDEVMALFPGGPEDALRAAVAIGGELVIYNRHRASCGYAPIKIGTGLHTGNLMLGMVGEAERLEGTVIADVVNVASRLESLNKPYGTSIIISQQVLEALQNPDDFHCRYLDKVQVKGKSEWVTVYEVLDNEEQVCRLKALSKPVYEKGLDLYSAGDFSAAWEKFNEVSAQNPEDTVAQLYRQRSENMMFMTQYRISVMLIDDQPLVGYTVGQMIEEQKDISFEYCQEPTAAAERAVELSPTVILLDLEMPDLDGLSLLRQMRTNEALAEVPVIVLSTREDAGIKAKAFSEGANDYLIKLPEALELIARIRYHSKSYINLQQRNRAAHLIRAGRSLTWEASDPFSH